MDHTYFEIDPAKAPPELLQNKNNLLITERAKLTAAGLSVLETQGYFERGGITLGDKPRPLLTLSFLDFMACIDVSDSSIVELGSGQSTLYFQQCFAQVDSFESDENWLKLLRPRLQPNVNLSLIDVARLEAFDIDLPISRWMLVDFAGRRTAFLHNLLSKRSTEALPDYIILDNAEWYRQGARILSEAGYQEIPFIGLKSAQLFVSTTSLFIKQKAPLFSMKSELNIPYTKALDNIWDQL